MAYNVRQLQELQDKISIEPDMPNAIDRYKALKLLQRKPVRRDHGGELRDNANELASKGRYGDTMLMHVTPEEVRGLSSLRGGVTINPETGLPEAFPWLPILIGAGLGGLGSAATGGDPIKGALLGAVGGFMPTALGGIAGATGLGSLWTGLGPIGQGMIAGGAMGGISSLFGDSDNPLRDMLIGAAMGGVGGAISGSTTGSTTGPTTATPDPNVLGTPSVPIYGQMAKTPIGTTANIQHFRRPSSLSGPVAATESVSFFDRPMSPLAPEYSGVKAGEAFGTKLGLGTDAPWYKPPSGMTTEEAIVAAQNVRDPSQATAQPNWFQRQDDLTKAGMIGGAGLLAASAFGEQPQQAELAQAQPPTPIPFLPDKPLRTPIGGRDEEFYVRTIGEGRTPEEAEYFTEEEEEVDVNVAKEGGIVSLFNGGNPYTSDPYGTPTYAMGLTNRPDAMERPRGSMGDPRYRTPMSLTEWNANFGPEASGSNDGGASPSPLVEQPFVFPEVTPFQTSLPAYNIEDRLSDIVVPYETTAPTPIATTEPVSPIPVSSLSPTGLGALQQIALANAASVAEQALAPTATVAAPVPTTAVNPEEQAIIDQFIGQKGGTIGLANGGSIPQFGTNTPVFEGRVQGYGDGMADQVAFGVVPQTPEDIPNTPDVALLSSDEYVVPADVVSMLGNGSSTAGSKVLDQFNKTMRMKAHGTNKQQRELDAGRELSSLV